MKTLYSLACAASYPEHTSSLHLFTLAAGYLRLPCFGFYGSHSLSGPCVLLICNLKFLPSPLFSVKDYKGPFFLGWLGGWLWRSDWSVSLPLVGPLEAFFVSFYQRASSLQSQVTYWSVPLLLQSLSPTAVVWGCISLPHTVRGVLFTVDQAKLCLQTIRLSPCCPSSSLCFCNYFALTSGK